MRVEWTAVVVLGLVVSVAAVFQWPPTGELNNKICPSTLIGWYLPSLYVSAQVALT
jgi:hypothetical protein